MFLTSLQLKIQNREFFSVILAASSSNVGKALILLAVLIAFISFLYRLIQDKRLIKEMYSLCKDLDSPESKAPLKRARLMAILKTFNPVMKGDRNFLKSIRIHCVFLLLKFIKNNNNIGKNALDVITSQLNFFDERMVLSFLIAWGECIQDSSHDLLEWEKQLLLVAQDFLSKITPTQVEDEVTSWDIFQKMQPRYLLLIVYLTFLKIDDAKQSSERAKNWLTTKENIVSYHERIYKKLKIQTSKSGLDEFKKFIFTPSQQ